MEMYYLLLALTFLTCIVFIVKSHGKFGDALNPTYLIGGIITFFYVIIPSVLIIDNQSLNWISEERLILGQFIFLLQTIFFMGGIYWGTIKNTEDKNIISKTIKVENYNYKYLFSSGVTIGLIGFIIWLYLIIFHGGFAAVYASAYSGANLHDSGWVRDTVFFCIPSIVLLFICFERKKSTLFYLLIIIMSIPFFGHGLMGARRGPLFIIVIVLIYSHYLFPRSVINGTRIMMQYGIAFILILLIYSNRSNLYWGSAEVITQSPFEAGAFKATEGNDYLTAVGYVTTAYELDQFGYLSGVLSNVLFRPIPKEILPNKYELFPDYSTTFNDFHSVMGWDISGIGSVPTLFGEIYNQFGWLSPLFSWIIGYYIGLSYAHSRSNDDDINSRAKYIFIMQGVLHLIAQDMKAFLVPFLLMYVPFKIILWFGKINKNE